MGAQKNSLKFKQFMVQQWAHRKAGNDVPLSIQRTFHDGPIPPAKFCQWIEGDPTPDDSCKCRKPVVEGRPYCEEHCARSYRKPDEAA